MNKEFKKVLGRKDGTPKMVTAVDKSTTPAYRTQVWVIDFSNSIRKS